MKYKETPKLILNLWECSFQIIENESNFIHKKKNLHYNKKVNSTNPVSIQFQLF